MPFDSMQEIDELIKQYGLEEDPEHVIVPFTDNKGRRLKRFLLKRRYVRIMYAEGHYVDYPLTDVIKATVKYPELLLSEAIGLLYRELHIPMPKPASIEELTEPARNDGSQPDSQGTDVDEDSST
jgi:hypothetical protein